MFRNAVSLSALALLVVVISTATDAVVVYYEDVYDGNEQQPPTEYNDQYPVETYNRWTKKSVNNNFRRRARLSGDLFQQLQAISKMVNDAEQHGCRIEGEMCSWSGEQHLQCCYNHACKCNLFGSNCKCVEKLFGK